MQSAAAILHSEAKTLARLMAEEMGKPVRDGVAEIEKCAAACTFFADRAAAPPAAPLPAKHASC